LWTEGWSRRYHKCADALPALRKVEPRARRERRGYVATLLVRERPEVSREKLGVVSYLERSRICVAEQQVGVSHRVFQTRLATQIHRYYDSRREAAREEEEEERRGMQGRPHPASHHGVWKRWRFNLGI